MPPSSAIIVGHSLFFRHVIAAHLHASLQESDLAKDISLRSTPSCGILKLTFDFQQPVDACLTDLRVVGDTDMALISDSGGIRRGDDLPMLPGYEHIFSVRAMDRIDAVGLRNDFWDSVIGYMQRHPTKSKRIAKIFQEPLGATAGDIAEHFADMGLTVSSAQITSFYELCGGIDSYITLDTFVEHARARLRQKLSERKLRRAMTQNGSIDGAYGQAEVKASEGSSLNQLLPRLAEKVSRSQNGAPGPPESDDQGTEEVKR